MRLTLFRDVRARSKEERDLTVDELAELVRATDASAKHELPLLKLGIFGDDLSPPGPDGRGGGSYRHDANLRLVTGVESDYDDERVSFDTAIEQARAAGVECILYTSPSHTPERPRWRGLFPLAGECLPEQRRVFAECVNAIFDGVLARETFTLSQAYYFGRVNDLFRIEVLPGRAIDTLSIDPVAYTGTPRLRDAPDGAPFQAPASVDDLPQRVKRVIKSGDPSVFGYRSRSEMVYYVACQLVRLGWSDERIAELLLNPQVPVGEHVRERRDARSYALQQAQRGRVAAASDWKRTPTGQVDPYSQANVTRALDELGARFYRDTFKAKSFVNGLGPAAELDDHQVRELRLMIDRQFSFCPNKDFFYDMVEHLAYVNPIHPVREYLAALEWDGVRRIGQPATDADSGCPGWVTTYGGAEDKPIYRLQSRLILLGAVHRIRDPGCIFDEMLVLVDPMQGSEKSSAIRALAVQPDWYTNGVKFHADPRQLIERMNGKWIIEFAELAGMTARGVEELKDFMSTLSDTARLAYGHFPETVLRHSVFLGTTNEDAFLRDIDNRRFWPIPCSRFDIPALKRDVDQLWAEAAHYQSLGESCRMAETYWPLAAVEQQRHRIEENWATWIEQVLQGRDGVIASPHVWDILASYGERHLGQTTNQRVGKTMRELGFTRDKRRLDGFVRPVNCYARGPAPHRQVYVIRDSLPPYRCVATYAPPISQDLGPDANNGASARRPETAGFDF